MLKSLALKSVLGGRIESPPKLRAFDLWQINIFRPPRSTKVTLDQSPARG